MSSQVRTKTTKNKATLFPKNSYKNGGGPPKPTPEQLAELARKQMLQITDAESYVRRLGNFYPKEDVESVRKSRVSNVTNTPIKYIDFSIAPTQAMYTYGSDLLGQPKNAQIEIYKDSKDNITTYLHELVHASTMSNRGLNKGEQDYIKSRVKKPADGSERDWYITDGTEVLARKAVVAKWAADNGIIDINSDVDENTFNLIGETLKGKKDKQSKEVLRHYNELLEATGNKPKNVIDIWNTVAQVDTNNEDLPPIAKNGGKLKKQREQPYNVDNGRYRSYMNNTTLFPTGSYQQGGYSWSQGANNVSTKVNETTQINWADDKVTNNITFETDVDEDNVIVPAKKSEYATTQSKETKKDINKQQEKINKLAKNILGNKGINDFTDEDVSILSQATLPNVKNVLRDYRINRANKAQEKPGSYTTTEGFRESTAAIGDKVSLQRLPVVGEYIPDVLDVTKGLGDMAAGLGAIPNNLNKGQYGQVAFNLGAPLLTGALGGLGARTTGQFANNLVNPLAGTGSLIDNLGNKYLPNVHKLNPLSFKPSPENYYRGIGETGLKDAIESGLLREGPASLFNGNLYSSPDLSTAKGYSYSSPTQDNIKISKAGNSGVILPSKELIKSYIAEIPKKELINPDNLRGNQFFREHVNPTSIPINKVKLYEQDWLRGYKPIEVPNKGVLNINDSTRVPKNLEDLNYLKTWAKEYDYDIPSNLERIAQSDELTNRTIRGVMNRHNTFVRGVSTNWDEINKKNPEILRHLEGKGIDWKNNPKAAAEYMSTHVPIQTGYGRASLNSDVFDRGLDGLYTSNSIPTAEGYTYGQGYITKVKKPTDYSSTNRRDWVDNNKLDFYRDKLPKIENTPAQTKSYEKDILRTERRDIIKGYDTFTDSSPDSYINRLNAPDAYKLKYNKDIEKIKKDLIIKVGGEKLEKYYELSQKYKGNPIPAGSDKDLMDKLKVELSPIINSQNLKKEYDSLVLDYIENSIPQTYKRADNYAHYIHLGTPGEKILEPVKSWEITPDIWKNQSRAHTNTYSRGLSALNLLPPTIGISSLLSQQSQEQSYSEFKQGGTPKILTMKKNNYKQGGKPNTLNISGIPNAQTGGATNPFGYYGGAGDMLTSIFGNISGSGLFKPQTGAYTQMSSSDYLNQNKYSTPYSKKDWLGNTTVYVKDASGNEVKYKDVYKDYQGYNKQAAEDFSTNQKQFNEMLPVGIQLAGLMDLQMKEQDEIANKKMRVQDFPTTAASYAPVGFAEEGGGVGSQQEMFPALRAMQKGLPPEMSKKARELVGKAAEEEVQVLEQMLGYRDDSPFRNKSSINIYSDTIDMGQKGDGTGTPLLAVADNGDSKILKPYSGTHFFPGASMVTEVPIAQNGGPTTHQDSVAHQANKILKYEQLKGGPGGAPLPSYADPRYLKMLMQDILPEVDKIMPNASAMEKAEAMDFVFNAGYDKTNKKITKDPRAYAIQEYYRKYDPSKLDKDGKWSGRKGAAYSFDDEYSNTIGRLPENERRVFMNMGRDWYYKNIENPAPGVYSPNYEDTWYGRIWNTNDYNEFDPNATKLVHPNKRKPQKRVNGGPSSPIPFIPSAVRIDPFDEKLKSLIKKHEGSVTDKQGKHVAYADSLGYQTIGYGHLMRGVEAPVMSQSAVDDLFNKDYQTHKSWAQKMPGFNNFSDSQKAAIIDMTFNLGDNWWEEFPIFTKALNQGDTNKAAQELRSSLWAKQVGPRADEVINLLQNKGNFQQGGQPTPKAQQGVMASRKNINQFPFLDRAGVTPAESSARSFIIDEIKSDGYREKIINLLPKNLSKTEKEKRAASLISSRLNALNSAVNAGIDSGLKEGHINAEYFGPSRLKPNLRFADNSMLNNTSINVHELEHAAKRGHKLIMPEEEDIVFQNIKNSRDVPKEGRDYHMYVASTPEIGANLMQFRKFVVDNKFAKHGEKITEDQFLKIWETLDESGDKYSQDAFYDVINTLKDTKSEDAISRFTKLYNTITNVGGKNNTSVFNAKNGGKPKNNNNEITKLLGMNKYENGGKVMQNYMPVGNGKTKVHGFINLASMIPIQTEKKEMIVLETGDLVPVNAKKRHSQMSDDEVTDIVPENSYILSQFGSVDIYKSEADQIQMEVENKPYNMYGSNPTPKVKTLGDIMRKKVMKPADMARLVEQKYKIMDHDDPFTIQTNAINKHRRGDYLQAIIQLSEYDKARKGIDNSIETQLAQNNRQPPQMVASNGGKVLRAGYNVPKAFNPFDLIGSLVSTGVGAYFTNKGMKESKRNMNNQLSDINTFNTSSLGNLGARTFTGLSSLALQNPLVKPTLQSDQFISQFPSYANASYNAAFEGNRNSLYANRPEFDGSKLSMLMGERYNAQTMQAQSQLAGQLAGQRTNMFSQYLQARQNIFNANSASRTAAENATTVNQNDLFGKFGAVGTAYFDDKTNLASTVLNARAAARGQNTANQIQLGNQMAQTLNNGLAAGLQAYNSSKNSTGVGGYSTNTATRAQQKQKECNNRGGQWICEDGICFCDN